MYIGYETVEICQEIKRFLSENRDIIMYVPLCRKAGISHVPIRDLLRGQVRSIDRKNIDKLLPFLVKLGFIYTKMTIDMALIEKTVCQHFNVPIDKLDSKSRKGELIEARQYVYKFGLELAKMSSAQIGKKMGGRDHVTVLHGRNKLNGYIETDIGVRATYEDLERRLKQA